MKGSWACMAAPTCTPTQRPLPRAQKELRKELLRCIERIAAMHAVRPSNQHHWDSMWHRWDGWGGRGVPRAGASRVQAGRAGPGSALGCPAMSLPAPAAALARSGGLAMHIPIWRQRRTAGFEIDVLSLHGSGIGFGSNDQLLHGFHNAKATPCHCLCLYVSSRALVRTRV